MSPVNKLKNPQALGEKGWFGKFVTLILLGSFSFTAAATVIHTPRDDNYEVDADTVLNVSASEGFLANGGTDTALPSFPPPSPGDEIVAAPAGVTVQAVNLSIPPGVNTPDSETLDSNNPFEVSSDGSFTYDPRGSFDYLAVGKSELDIGVSIGSNRTTQYYNSPGPPDGVPDVFIVVNGVNDAPTDITLTNDTISESASSGTTIGTFSTEDIDNSDTHEYSLVSGSGSADNGFFTIAGNQLNVGFLGLDFEFKTTYSIRVRSADRNAAFGTLNGTNTDKIFTITVTDANDNAPVFTSSDTISVDENTTAVVTLTTTDVDTIGDNPPTFSIGGGADQGDFSLSTNALTFSPAPDFEAPTDSNADNVYVVDIRAFDGVNQSFQTITVTVDNVSDVNPEGTANSETISEEGTYNFSSADFGFSDVDGDTLQAVELTTLPSSGFIKDNGVNVTVPGTSIAEGDISTLTYEPAADASGNGIGSFTFTVQDSSGASDSSARNFTINVTPVADAPTVTPVAASGDEDSDISLTLGGSLVDTDGSEVLSYQVSGVPSGATLSAGSDTGGGVWDLTAADASGLTIRPPTNDDTNFSLSVTAIATESGNGDSASSSAASLAVTVDAVADVPSLSVSPASGNEDTAIALSFSGTLLDTDGSESLSYTVSNVPTGASLNAGSNLGGGVWSLTPAQLGGLAITPPLHEDSTINLSVVATSTDNGGVTADSAAGDLEVSVTGVADTPAVPSVSAASGNEDTGISLSFSSTLVDTDGSETLSYQISGVPSGASLNNGANAGGGVWNLTIANLTGLTITPPLHDADNFNLSVSAIATESGSGDDATSSAAVLAVTVTEVADEPDLDVDDARGDEDQPIDLDISADLEDTDGSETLSFQVTGVPTGATLNNGTDAGGGVWNLTAADVVGLTITPPLNDGDLFILDVTATATEGNGDFATTASQEIEVVVIDKADTPTVSVTGAVATDEDIAVGLTISGALTDLDGSEELTYRITNVPTGASLSAGTNNGGGQWTLTPAQLAGLTLTPPLHEDDEFTITVRSRSEELANGNSAFSSNATITVTVTAVADAPNFVVGPTASGNEDIAIALPISSSLVDTDGSETLTLQVTGVPAGATLNNGTDAGGGTWNLDESDLSGLTILNDPDDDSDFTISVTATSTEDNDGSVITLGPDDIDITVRAVADAPAVVVTSVVTQDEDDNPFPLTIAGDLTDTDGSESMSYQITGVIDAATLSAGTKTGATTWELTEAEAEGGLTLTMDDHVATDFQITVQALATEARDGSTQLSSPSDGRININVTDRADDITIDVTSPAVGIEDNPVPLTISGTQVDVDGSETFTMFITGHPAGSTFSAGTDLGGGMWGVDAGSLAGLTISAAADNNDDFTLTVTATAVEQANGDTKDTTETIDVEIQAVNDAPSLSPASFTIDENLSDGSLVGTMVATDIEPVGGELAQTFTYEIEGTAFAINSNGEITVANSSQVDFETTPTFNLQVTVRDSGLPSESATANVTISLNNLNDNPPDAVTDDVSVDEQASVNFNVLTNDTDADLPLDTLEVASVDGDIGLVGVPVDVEDGGTVVGTVTINSDGSATFVATSVNEVEIFAATIEYAVSDGLANDVGTVNFTINPQNDNQPELSTAGVTLQTSGVEFDEDQYPAQTSGFTVVVTDLFSDLDIDGDGIQDSNTLEDNDSLVFSVINNTDPTVLQFNLDSGDLTLWSELHDYGSSTITIRATDTAAPLGNISFVDLNLLVTINSVNDAPIYTFGTYSDYEFDEDSQDIDIDLAGAFVDADLNDATPGDDQITYRITIVDTPNPFVLTPMIDATGLTVISDDTPDDSPRTLVVETTDPNITLAVFEDAHGTADITVRATDEGRPPLAPAAALPLFDEESFRVTVNGIGDDQPTAENDHYNDNVDLVIDEDSDPLFFDVLLNDYQGDVPAKVVIVGQSIVDSSGAEQALISSTRLADPNDTGDFQIEVNGEVSCAFADCLDAQRGVVTVDGSGIADSEIIYQPRPDFNGEDSFTYCIEDSASAGDPYTCATVTINVLPVNDPPVVDSLVQYTMDQADDLIVTAEEGLRTFVRDIDNTHIDGLGCDPLLDTCNPGPSDPQPDRLYFYFDSATTDQGGLLFPPFLDDGSFNYRPAVTFAGDDSFTFQVCDEPTPGDADHCAPGTVVVQIDPADGAAAGSTETAVQFDYQLAQTPLELPIGPEPNVLVVNDDSGSMAWDIMSEGNSGLYQVSTGQSLYYVNVATAGSSRNIAPAESVAPNQGLWRLRNSSFNTVYYNPEIRYEPWEGLDTGDNEFPDSPPTAARHNPLSGANTTNLTQTIDFTGRAVLSTPRTCTRTCRFRIFGICLSFRTRCTGGDGFQDVATTGFYIPRYYRWTDLNGNGELDATPSPANEAASCATNRVLGCSEGELIEIRNDGTVFPRGSERTDCGTSETSCTYDEEMQNFANWFTYYRSREFTAKAALGVVVSQAQNLRLGYAKLNSESGILPVESMNNSERTGAKADLLDAVYATTSSGGTPLRRSLRDAGRYFECVGSDIFNSTGETSAGNDACPILPAPDGNCQQNFTLLITDGTWNGSSPSTGNSDGDNNTNFDGGAFAGSEFTTLADVAMLYYERDLHPDLDNEVPTTARDRSLADSDAFENDEDEFMHQHMTTYTVGFGVRGLVEEEPVNFATGFNWGNPFSSDLRKTDDVRHAAYNGRGEYLDASNAANLAERLVEAFDEFSQGSGAASAVSFNSQEIQQDTLIFRAFYNTKINTGDLIAQRLTEAGLEEEPVWNSASVLDTQPANTRQIITYDAVLSQGIPFRPGNLNEEQKAVFIDDPLATEAQKNAEVTQRVNYLRGDPSLERPIGNFRDRPTVEGRLGDIVHSTPVFVGLPNRPERDTGEFPAGYAQFQADLSEPARKDMIYVAANDGMLHGFDAADGSEVFGYVPNNLMTNDFSRKITSLLDFNYEHKFFVDITPALNDIYIDADENGSYEWATVLVGGHGAGAKAYFALDVTDPTQLTEASASSVALWEFTEEDDTYPTNSDGTPLLNGDGTQRQDLRSPAQPVKDLGYSFSVPTLAMSNVEGDNGEKEWVAMFGNGYNATSGIAKLFLLFVDKGIDGTWCHPDMIHNETLNGALPAECVGEQDFVKIDTGFGVDPDSGFPNGLGAPRGIDIDRNGTLDYAYAGDTFGNFFRFDLTSGDFRDWSVTKIFEAKYEDAVGNVTPQPITTRPIVTEVLGVDGLIVIFGTGSYITVPDGSNRDIQSIYGLFDRLSPVLIEIDDLVQQRYINVADPVFGNVRVLTSNEVDASPTGVLGWYNHLDSVAAGGSQLVDDPEFPGEKAIRNIQLRGGLAFVNSIIPRSDTSCVDVAGGFALSFCPATGGSNCLGPSGAIFDLNNDGTFDSASGDGGAGAIAGIRFEDAVPTDSSFIEDKRVTQLSDKSLDIIGTDTDSNDSTGPLSWKELDSTEFD